MNTTKTSSKIKNKDCQLFTINHFVELSNNFNQVFYGLDYLGETDDLTSFNDCIDCSMTESISYFEHLFESLNVEFIKHVTVSFDNFDPGKKMDDSMMELSSVKRFDQNEWIEKLKRFYIIILSNKFLYNRLIASGYSLSHVENIIELAAELEGAISDIKKDIPKKN